MDAATYDSEAHRHADLAARFYREGGEAWVRAEHQLARTLFDRGAKEIARSAESRAIAEALKRAQEPKS